MNKIILIVVFAVIVIVAIVAGIFWYMSTQPLYQPGMVREGKNLRAPLTPPEQPADAGNMWLVEPDIRLYHFSQGQGRHVLIVHGGPGMPYRQPWTGLEPLTAVYQFTYYDQRGSGKSSRPIDRFSSNNMYENMTTLDRTLGLGAQIADIERIRQILGDDKLIIIGHSWGGFLASLYAAEFPEHVEALILVSPATTLVMPQQQDDLFASTRARLPQQEQAGFDAFMKDYMDFGGLFKRSETDLIALNTRFGEYYSQVMPLNNLPAQGEPGGWMTWAGYVSMGQSHDYRPALRSVTAPVLVLHGSNDLQSEAASRQYSDLFPNARFAVIDGATHFSFEEQPQQFSALVSAFLENR
ncbi:MAG: alpha/beta hydrolase [Anaerolineae bacterium]|nr:alpha/beta hydrolase [Anaerolineae bacterium]